MTARALVIDDSRTARRATAATLDVWGWSAVETARASEGVRLAVEAKLAGDPFDVAVLDLGEGSAEVVRLLRSAGVLTVVVWSGREAGEVAATAASWGADAGVGKRSGLARVLAEVGA